MSIKLDEMAVFHQIACDSGLVDMDEVAVSSSARCIRSQDSTESRVAIPGDGRQCGEKPVSSVVVDSHN